jgi:hypothetical protein
MVTIEDVLQKLMTEKCVGVHLEGKKCHKKGKCDGSCPDFVVACQSLEELQDRREFCRNC